MRTVTDYIKTNSDRFFDELAGLIRIPSVSAREENRKICFVQRTT